MAKKSAALVLDTTAFEKMLDNLSPENREAALNKAMYKGACMRRDVIRKLYRSAKPNSDLYNAITLHVFPNSEGAVVRRFYVKGGVGDKYKGTPLYRAYVLNFLEKGATDRRTKGKGRIYRGMKYYNLSRGSIPALKFFQKGKNRQKAKILKEMERILLVELAKQARK